ncbi:MAG: glycoside hydrolase family 5 protein [Ginsengibacter sp.]
MKNHVVIFSALVTILLFSADVICAQGKNSKDFAFEQNKRLGRGVNIIGYDPLWKDPSKARMKDRHFKLIKEAGFSNVRIVIAPFKFSLGDSAYSLNPLFFERLDWAINNALKNKLMAIVDFHEHVAMGKDPVGTRPMFLAMWKQIAEHCKNYSNNVLFEIANEPNMKPEVWNNLYGEAYKIIRASNPKRTLIIGSINGNQIKYLQDLVLPEDDRNIIVAIHYYSPMQFTHQGAPWSVKNKDLSGIEWKETEAETLAIKKDFDMAQEWAKQYNRPLTLGEFGAYEKGDMASRVRWTNYIARQAEKRKWSWSYWQFDSDFIVYDLDKDEWIKPIRNALLPLPQ